MHQNKEHEGTVNYLTKAPFTLDGDPMYTLQTTRPIRMRLDRDKFGKPPLCEGNHDAALLVIA